MKNTILKKYKNTCHLSAKKIIITAGILLWLEWCWGWWGWGETPWNNISNNIQNPPVSTPNWDLMIKWKVWVWNVSQARVIGKLLSWETLFITSTNEKWEYEVNKKELQEKISLFWWNEETKIQIETEWWIDTSPNNDGIYNNITKIINGKVKWLLSLKDIDQSIITPISTAVIEILLWNQNENLDYFKDENGKLDTNKINKTIDNILQNLPIWDINNDWYINQNDLYKYDMIKNESILETDMRNNGYIESSIYSGNQNLANEYIENLKNQINLIQVGENINPNITTIFFQANYPYANIEYSLDWVNYTTYFDKIEVVNGQQNPPNIYFRGVYKNGNTNQVYYQEIIYWSFDNQTTTSTTLQPITTTSTTSTTLQPIVIINPPTTTTLQPTTTTSTTTTTLNNTPIEEETNEIEEKQNEPIINIIEDTPIYNPIQLPAVENIENVKNEIINLQNNLSTLEQQKASQEIALQEKTKQITQIEQNIETTYNSFWTTAKKMVDGNITQQEKTAYLDMNYSVQNTYAIASNTTKKYLSWNSNTIMTWVNSGLSSLQDKKTALQKALDTLKVKLTASEKEYTAKYNEYVKLKAEYDEDQRLYKESVNNYDIYKDKYNTLLAEFKSLWTVSNINLDVYSIIKWWSLDTAITRTQARQNEYILPKWSSYSLDTTSTSKRNGIKYTFPEISLLWEIVYVEVVYGINGWTLNFPAEMYIVKKSTNNTSTKITIKNNTHKDDMRDYLEKAINCEILIKKLEILKTNYEEAKSYEGLALFYGIVKAADKDMYKEEYDKYLTAKSEYDKLSVLYDAKIKELQDIETQILNSINF